MSSILGSATVAHHRLEFEGGVAALHGRQHAVAAGLHRQVQERHQLGQAGVGVHHALGHFLGVRGGVADAFDAGDLMHVLQQHGEIGDLLYPGLRVEDDRIFIESGAIWTSAGVTAGIDLALAMVEADLGAEVAAETAREMVVYHRRSGGQSQFSALQDLAPDSERIRPGDCRAGARQPGRQGRRRAVRDRPRALPAGLRPGRSVRALATGGARTGAARRQTQPLARPAGGRRGAGTEPDQVAAQCAGGQHGFPGHQLRRLHQAGARQSGQVHPRQLGQRLVRPSGHGNAQAGRQARPGARALQGRRRRHHRHDRRPSLGDAPAGQRQFRTAAGTAITTQDPGMIALMETLAQAWPRSLPFAALLETQRGHAADAAADTLANAMIGHLVTLVQASALLSDVLGRALARELEKQLGKTIIVENKAGGGAAIGANFVARAKPDGYTLLLGSTNEMVVARMINNAVKYDGAKDFTALGVELARHGIEGAGELADLVAFGRFGQRPVVAHAHGLGAARQAEQRPHQPLGQRQRHGDGAKGGQQQRQGQRDAIELAQVALGDPETLRIGHGARGADGRVGVAWFDAEAADRLQALIAACGLRPAGFAPTPLWLPETVDGWTLCVLDGYVVARQPPSGSSAATSWRWSRACCRRRRWARSWGTGASTWSASWCSRCPRWPVGWRRRCRCWWRPASCRAWARPAS